MSSFKQSAAVLLFLFCVACNSFSKIQTANPLMTSAAMTSPPQNITSETSYKLRPTITLTPSFTPTPTNTPVPLDLSHLEITGLDLSIIPPVNELKTVNGCYMLFMDAECIRLLNNTLLQGTAAKNKVTSLVSEGILEPAYGDSLDQIAQDYRIFTLNRLYLREGYAAFVHVPGEGAAISPAALAPLGDDYYKVVFLLPRDANVYVLGLYVVESGEIIGLYNVSTGI